MLTGRQPSLAVAAIVRATAVGGRSGRRRGRGAAERRENHVIPLLLPRQGLQVGTLPCLGINMRSAKRSPGRSLTVRNP